ncbi:hypothetical protein [Methanoregula sp.]|uniref:hypothetical protein n=1 Tax=Methanoregula sp. TaxID=2052170 RepID=UPI0025DAB0CD|nr:hypothetical protein [Methanoregula sp.]
MFQNFCTRVARKIRRLGYAKKVAARFAKFFYVSMITTCGLFGLFFVIPQELFEPIAIVGQIHADTRYGTLLPATFIIRR